MPYYAVAKGQKPGIYKTWSECQKQVTGFSGAIFKKFVDYKEAKAFLETISAPAKKPHEAQIPRDALLIYTDGSFSQNLCRNVSGWAAIIFAPGTHPDDGARPLTHLYGVTNADSRNVSGELQAVQQGIIWAIRHNYRKIHIVADYLGVIALANSSWQARTLSAQEYVTFIDKHRSDVNLSFTHVRGHTGDTGNELADKYAKVGIKKYLGIDNVSQSKNRQR